jgi:uncharacterized protein with GYD domain
MSTSSGGTSWSLNEDSLRWKRDDPSAQAATGQGGGSMPMYAMLSTLTDEGRKTVRNNPDRITEVNRELEKMGAKVITQYAALGIFDFITILEANDNLDVANISVQLGSRGTVQIQTVPLIEVKDFINTLKKNVS